MLYLGHFSFDTEHDERDDADEDATVEHGYFTVLASAATVTEAFEKFKALIPRVGRDQDLFDAGTRIFLDACVEVTDLPAEGLVSHVVVALDGEHSIAASLLGAPQGSGQAYGWGETESEASPVDSADSADRRAIAADDDETERDLSHAEPFLVVT